MWHDHEQIVNIIRKNIVFLGPRHDQIGWTDEELRHKFTGG